MCTLPRHVAYQKYLRRLQAAPRRQGGLTLARQNEPNQLIGHLGPVGIVSSGVWRYATPTAYAYDYPCKSVRVRQPPSKCWKSWEVGHDTGLLQHVLGLCINVGVYSTPGIQEQNELRSAFTPANIRELYARQHDVGAGAMAGQRTL